ncbi:MAG TPA: alpha/beta fold hydrolase [Vicinamibacteria bacterium]|nr:alpha/beta fold hydrolase [Vicinamibacteria bacterium]
MTPRAARPSLVAVALLLAAGATADAPTRVSDEAYRALARFYQYDTQVPLDARVVKRDESAPTYVREKVVFTGSRGDRVPGWLMLPRAGARPFPVVVILDGWMGTKDRWWADDTWPQGGLFTKALAAAGIAALVLDAQFHGERADAIGFQPVEEYVCDACANARREMVMETIVDYRRALDYLATRDELDRRRIGAIGFSMGGVMTTALAAIDDRVRTAVTCVTPVRPGDPKWSSVETSPLTFAPRVRVPTLVLMGRTDHLYSQADAEAYRDALGSSEKALEWYDSGHRLPPEYVPRAVGWMKSHLQ